MDVVSREPTVAVRLRSILGGAAGNLVEWFDWYAYSAFALYFAGVFFPKADPTAQLLNTAAVFAVGFVMRPVGGWLMGAFADRKGRKVGLTLSVVLMCVGALLIALCPSYARIGAAAPAVLVVARLLQGLSLGGEYGASAVYLSEMAGRKHRGFWSSFQYVTLISGQLVSLALLLVLQACLTSAQMEAWGWRIPFALGGVLALAVWHIRRGLAETESFRNAERAGIRRGALADLIGPHRREAALVLALTAGGTVAFYAYSIYMQKFLANTSGFSRDTASAIMALALLLYTCLQPLAGALSRSDRAQAADGGIRRVGDAADGADLHHARACPLGACGVRAGDGGSGVDHRLYVDQRGGEGRVVPGRGAGARRRAALCDRQCAVRRHRGICRVVEQGCRP